MQHLSRRERKMRPEIASMGAGAVAGAKSWRLHVLQERVRPAGLRRRRGSGRPSYKCQCLWLPALIIPPRLS